MQNRINIVGILQPIYGLSWTSGKFNEEQINFFIDYVREFYSGRIPPRLPLAIFNYGVLANGIYRPISTEIYPE